MDHGLYWLFLYSFGGLRKGKMRDGADDGLIPYEWIKLILIFYPKILYLVGLH